MHIAYSPNRYNTALNGLGKIKIKPLKKIFGVQKKKSKAIANEITLLQAEPYTPENEARISELMANLSARTRRAKKESKKFAIIAAIVSIVVGVFTFGAGGVAVQGAFQAMKQGAIAIAKKILMSAIAAAISKGASKKDTAKATESVNDLEKYPPDRNLTSLDAMIADSQTKKMAAQSKPAALLIPAGIITLISLYS